jgi:hypothetical protein
MSNLTLLAGWHVPYCCFCVGAGIATLACEAAAAAVLLAS